MSALQRRAGVVGSPISHSLSPLLHRAAYAALGLDGWSYDAFEVRSGELARFVDTLGPEWVGLSVTMPGKEEALALGTTTGSAAELTGAANTLVRRPQGWYADNTDVHGLTEALREAGVSRPRRATILGGGATARSALVALSGMGVEDVTMVVRDRPRAETGALAERLGLGLRVRRLGDGAIALGQDQDVLVGTLPGSAPAPAVTLTGGAEPRPVMLDVAYSPWPSALATAVSALGPGAPTVSRGTGMLLHQAARQVQLMTGHDGPVEAMRDALGPGEGIDG